MKTDVLICFIVLHYLELDLTIKTVNSICGLENLDNSQIIIVDNSSPNGSGEKLKSFYASQPNVHVIIAESNMGFAQGNNIGYFYIKEHFTPKYLIAVNNDVIFCQKDFIKKLDILYKRSLFWVAGPDIYIPSTRFHQSPIMIVEDYVSENQMKEINKKLYNKNKSLEKNDLSARWQYYKETRKESIIVRLVFLIRSTFFDKREIYSKQSENGLLHGSCLIFDKRYIDESDYLFRPVTFMYSEEQVLRLECFLNSRKMVYLPQLRVDHMHEGTKKWNMMSYKEWCIKKMKRNDQAIEANNLYIRFLKETMKEKTNNMS